MADQGKQIRPQRQAAVHGVLREKAPQLRKHFVGPVPAACGRGETEPIRHKHRVRRNSLGGCQVLAQQGRRDDERIAGIGKAFAGRAVNGEVPRRLKIHTGEIANRIVVFCIGQPAQHDPAGIACMGASFLRQHAAQPAHHALPVLRSGLGIAPGRHLRAFHHLQNKLPRPNVFRHQFEGREPFKIQVALVLPGGMALQTVPRD